jgi:ABC-type nitrate/sulfonate/bicarbonate transport system substrate-binding protein
VVDQAVQQNLAHYVTPSVDLNTATSLGAANGVMVANSSLYGNKTLMQNFMKAYVESMKYYIANPDKWATVGAQLTGANQTLLAAALKHQQATFNVDVKAAEEAAKYGPKFGYATTDVSGQIPSIVDVSALSQVTGKSQSDLTQPVPWTGG